MGSDMETSESRPLAQRPELVTGTGNRLLGQVIGCWDRLLVAATGNWLLGQVIGDCEGNGSMTWSRHQGRSMAHDQRPRIRALAPNRAGRDHPGHALAHDGLSMSRAQADVPFFERCRETRPHIDQLLRAVGAISANLEEGYGRSGAADRAHFYEYALSTAREARGWYFKCAAALPAEVLSSRLSVFTQIIRMLTKAVPEVRASTTRWRPRRESDNKPPPEPNQ